MRRPRRLRDKMLAVTLLLLGIVGSATLYTGFATADLARSLGLLFRRNLLVEDIRSGIVDTGRALSDYLTSRSSDSLESLEHGSGLLAGLAGEIRREVRDEETSLLQRQLAGLVDSYLEDARAAAEAKREGRITSYTTSFERSAETAELVRFIVDRIERRNLHASIEAYTGLDRRIGAIVATNAVLVVAAVLMALVVFVRYIWAITGPLSTLADSARAIAQGDYDRELPLRESAEEIATMTEAFENMRRSVRTAFEELHAKAEVERLLMEESLRLVDMDRRLKDAELLALQAQINPHFLFNTLAAGMQLALVEHAERTGDFLEKLSGFIRYALRSPSRLVHVADEIECVGRYIWLLRLRFGEHFTFSVHADPGSLGVPTPALVLQPLVENAVNHGLHDLEEGGAVGICARLAGNEVLLEVSDTGVGIEPGELARLRAEGCDGSAEFQGSENEVSEGGIGLRNVIRRVCLATGGRGRVEIESAPGKGTTVRLRLPAPGNLA